MQPIYIQKSGMVTGVGLTGPSSLAAIRAGISRYKETRFMYDGEWLYGCEAPLMENGLPMMGREKLLRMATMAAKECLDALNGPYPDIPIVLCVSEKSRPGRYDNMGALFLTELRRNLGLNADINGSTVIAEGKAGIASAFKAAERYLYQTAQAVILVGVDSYMRSPTLDVYFEKNRLMTEESVNGFYPGEGAGALLLTGPGYTTKKTLICFGIGEGSEKVTVETEKPFKADGMTSAIKAALKDARRTFNDLDYRIVDVNGEHYAFKEASLALSRSMHILKDEFDIWHPSDCIGETGAAVGPIVLGVALDAARKGYAPGDGVLCHFSNDDGLRSAMVLGYAV